ncbi:hypothetical protein Tmath_0839 [Thermoanaerobacter mathranii subsp. mathranii str. A3]|uniref:Uncharacterized protein n=2 Tax=Thermoanaerobacter TaxID=1754 RepID=A0ABN3Z374_THEM3|nr:hypothetical protein [Thermoanaerobacter mathranii]ADH60576.1 hypothetical protein Tmath_0839 [Thermoanaerobacter mathranii subsp. mathranii str. A3]
MWFYKMLFSIGRKKRIIVYLMVLFFNIQISILASEQIELINSLYIKNIYTPFSRLIYFALYYVPLFLISISDEDILNHSLILTRLKSIDMWWKEKVKLLLMDTMLYVIFLELPIIIMAVIHIGVTQIVGVKNIAFMVGDFIIKYIIFFIIGISHVISSFISKKQYIGFLVGYFIGGFDYILTLFHLDGYAMTTTGMLVEFIVSFDLPTGNFLFLSSVYSGYLVFLSLFLLFISKEILRKMDLQRGDLK